jgi:acyl-CoA reductase-like NAD-dependent aldehyde dehydrogenase
MKPEQVQAQLTRVLSSAIAELRDPRVRRFLTSSVQSAVFNALVSLRLERGAFDRLLTGAYYQSGQSCIAVQRIIVHEAVREALTEALVRKVRRLRRGDPRDERTCIGPLIDEAAARLKIELDSMPTEIDEVDRKRIMLEIEREAIRRANVAIERRERESERRGAFMEWIKKILG